MAIKYRGASAFAEAQGFIRSGGAWVEFGAGAPTAAPTGFSDAYDLYGLALDPAFNPAAPTLKNGTVLTGDALKHYNASVYGLVNNNATTGDARYTNIVNRMGQLDSYDVSRNGQNIFASLMPNVRMTGDPYCFDRVVAGFEALWVDYATRIAWTGTNWSPSEDVASGDPWNPYRKSLYYYSGAGEDYVLRGTDLNRLEAQKLFTMMAEFALALHINRGVTSPAGYNYSTLADRWITEVENTLKAWSGGDVSGSSGTWRDNYKGVDGWSESYGFSQFLGRYTERAPEGFYPMFARDESHSAFDSVMLHYYLYRLGEAGFDIPNHAAALTACDMMMQRILDAGHVTCTTDLGPGLLGRRGEWFSGTTTGAGAIAFRTTYTPGVVGHLISAWLIGRWRDIFTREVMKRISRTYSISTLSDGTMWNNLGRGSTDNDLIQEGTEPTQNVWRQAARSPAQMCVFEGAGETHLEEVSKTVQAGFAGGYVTPTYGKLAQGLFLKEVLNDLGDLDEDFTEPTYLNDAFYNDVVAFEGAMGYGANTTGGRGNGASGDTALVFVDNLNDSGAGSLRAALEGTGKRVIVPRVGGYVPLTSEIKVRAGNGDFTFLGMLAPGGGLAARYASLPAYRYSPVTIMSVNNIIFRYFTSRAGQVEGFDLAKSPYPGYTDNCYSSGDTLRVYGVNDGIFDHISVAFGTDSNFDFSGERITMQHCLITHPLAYAGHYEGDHAFNLQAGGNGPTSQLYNLIANANERAPEANVGDKFQYIGNVIYNMRYAVIIRPDSNAAGFADVPYTDFRRNTFKHGPMTITTEREIRFRNITTVAGLFCPTYLEGNVSPWITGNTLADQKAMARELSPNNTTDSITIDDWVVELPVGTPEIPMRTAAEAFDYVMLQAGNNRTRDSLDTLVVNQAKGLAIEMTTRPRTVAEAGGYPTIASGAYPTANADGIPDGWRTYSGETRAWYELDTGGTGRMVIENYADDVAQGRYTP